MTSVDPSIALRSGRTTQDTTTGTTPTTTTTPQTPVVPISPDYASNTGSVDFGSVRNLFIDAIPQGYLPDRSVALSNALLSGKSLNTSGQSVTVTFRVPYNNLRGIDDTPANPETELSVRRHGPFRLAGISSAVQTTASDCTAGTEVGTPVHMTVPGTDPERAVLETSFVDGDTNLNGKFDPGETPLVQNRVYIYTFCRGRFLPNGSAVKEWTGVRPVAIYTTDLSALKLPSVVNGVCPAANLPLNPATGDPPTLSVFVKLAAGEPDASIKSITMTSTLAGAETVVTDQNLTDLKTLGYTTLTVPLRNFALSNRQYTISLTTKMSDNFQNPTDLANEYYTSIGKRSVYLGSARFLTEPAGIDSSATLPEQTQTITKTFTFTPGYPRGSGVLSTGICTVR